MKAKYCIIVSSSIIQCAYTIHCTLTLRNLNYICKRLIKGKLVISGQKRF